MDNLPWGTMRLKELSQRSAFRNCLIKVICLRTMWLGILKTGKK